MRKEIICENGGAWFIVIMVILSMLPMSLMTSVSVFILIVEPDSSLFGYITLIAFMLIGLWIFFMGLKCTNIFILTDETIVQKNLFCNTKKRKMWSQLCSVHKYILYTVRSSEKFYCFNFRKNMTYYVGEESRSEANKDPDVIIIPLTGHNTKILRKYVPEKFLPYLDAPIDRSDKKSLNDELLLYDKSKDMELINDPDFTEKENSQQEQKQDEQTNQTDVETVLANADQADDMDLPPEDKE